ncbi:MAG: glycosyl transferase family 1, partial [Bacteroidales bacterium]|nr:glycosyl transferase family 1 [Bacteroidales bacterium]
MKKVLIISYYWPPAGGISVLRTLKFTKYLRKFGWEPIVYAPQNASYLYLDKNNFDDIPENIEIIRRKILEPFNLFRILTGRNKNDTSNPVYATSRKSFLDNFSIWLRGNFFIPDARCLWIKPSVKFLTGYLKENPADAILTDGPPHTNTVIGMRLAQKFNIPFLADFQDPWTQVDYYKMMKIGKRADKKHHRLEQEVFRVAKKITIASPTWAKDLEKIEAKNVDTIYYGYDEEDFKNITNQKGNNTI